MTPYKILILTAPTGHLTQARAVRSYFDDLSGVHVQMADLVGENLEWDLFRFMYRYAPFLMRIPFEVTRRSPAVLRWIGNTHTKRMKESVLALLDAEDPDLVVTTYHGYIPILDGIRQNYRFKYVNPITDPISLHPILFSRAADYNIGFDERCVDFGRSMGISPQKIAPAGWFTPRLFFERQPVEQIRAKLGLEALPTLLVCAGSEGNLAVLGLLPALLFRRQARPFQVIFIAGTNRSLAHTLKAACRRANRVNPAHPRTLVVPFTDHMVEYIAVSDVVIGKAGPNLIFESVAQRKPFVAIAHISGNEDGNLNLIRQHNLGWVAENPLHANRLITDILRDPSLLAEKAAAIERMAARGCQGGLFLREKILTWMLRPPEADAAN